MIRPEWPAHPRVRAFVTTRAEGDMASEAARRALPVRSRPIWLRQVHGAAVFNGDSPAGKPEADAAVSRTPGVVCAVMVADCMPVLFADEDGSTVAAAHAGWRGLCAGVLEATVAAMRVPAGRLLAWMGPAIGPRAYEVGEEVRIAFLRKDPAAGSAFAPVRPGHWLLDLYAVARQRLQASGVSRIHGGGFCTHTDEARFYSYRRDRAAERMAALVWLATPGE